jgi:hypothetical protein
MALVNVAAGDANERHEEEVSALGLLFERVATKLPIPVLELLLRPFPVVELARLACVHKAFRLAWQSLR